MLHDLRYALRMLGRSPGFTLVAVITLALGIGGTSTMFGVLDALFLQPPAGVAAPDGLVRVFVVRDSGNIQSTGGGSYPDLIDLAAGARGLAAVAGYSATTLDFDLGPEAQQLDALLVTAGYFPLLGVRPAVGRLFAPEEDSAAGAHPVAVLGHGFWRRQFGGDPAIVGRTVTLAGRPFTVIGVASERFTGLDLPPADIWVPMAMRAALGMGDDRENRYAIWMSYVGRLAPGISVDQAAAGASAVLRHAAEPTSELDQTPVAVLTSIGAASGPERSKAVSIALWLGAVTGIVLLIACANLANLLLVRAAGRRREIAVRLSLGVTRGRLARQLLTESLVLALMGGAAGLTLALWAGDLVRLFPLPAMPSLLGGRVVAFTLGISLLTGIAFGLVPALQAGRGDLATALKDGASSVPAGRSRLRDGLVTMQVALTLVLLVGAGLFVRSLSEAHTVDLGLDVDRLLRVGVDLGKAGHGTAAQQVLRAQALERIAALPGVERASQATLPPLGGWRMSWIVRLPGGDTLPALTEGPYMDFVGPGYFATLGIPLRSGRDFTASDLVGSRSVAVVNESMARAVASDGSAVGRCIIVQEQVEEGGCTEIVGVVANVASDGIDDRLDGSSPPYVYLARAQRDPEELASMQPSLFVRVRGRPDEMIAPVRAAVQGIAPGLPYVNVEPMTSVLAPQLLPYRMGAILFGIFGAIALLLAAVGLYGVVAHGVAQRTREIGVRIALGARQSDILSLVVRQGMLPALLGAAAGLVLAFAATRYVQSLLFGVSATDLPTYLGVAALLVAVALVACLLPARRATRVDPLVALRQE